MDYLKGVVRQSLRRPAGGISPEPATLWQLLRSRCPWFCWYWPVCSPAVSQRFRASNSAWMSSRSRHSRSRPQRAGQDPERTMVSCSRIEERLGEQPGVTNVGAARIALLSQRGWTAPASLFRRFEQLPPAGSTVATNAVSPGYLDALSIPLRGGRRALHPLRRCGTNRVRCPESRISPAQGRSR